MTTTRNFLPGPPRGRRGVRGRVREGYLVFARYRGILGTSRSKSPERVEMEDGEPKDRGRRVDVLDTLPCTRDTSPSSRPVSIYRTPSNP